MDKSSINIIIVLHDLRCGGTERAATELANYIAGKEGKVTLVLMYKIERFYHVHPDVKIIEPSFTKKKLGLLYIPFLIIFLRSQFKKQQPDIILALGYIAFTLFSSVGLKAKVIISFRSSPGRIRFPENKIFNLTYKIAHYLMRKRVNGIIAQTSQAADAHKKLYSCPMIIIPNFLKELKEYKHERINQIVTVGRCSSEKGQHFLIEAFAKLDEPDWTLVIVGDGPKRKELENLAHKLQINDRVLFTGFQENVDFYYSQSKIFALTSMIEGFPNALIEAMANSLAPVSFNCEAGPSEIIQHGKNGFLVEIGDVDGFAYYLSKLMRDDILRNSIATEAFKAKSLYSLDTIAERYLDFILSVLRRNENLQNLSNKYCR